MTLPPTHENYHFVQPLGGDDWLLVRGRAKGNSDQSAHVYDSAGTLSRSFHAGDGVEDIQTTEDGRTWVSYFDEGVFGDTTLGQAGLVCLDSSGEVTFRFNDLAARGTDIADCYALNVCSNREVWLCYYTDFPLVQLADGKIAETWPGLSVKGSHAFAVSGRKVFFAGGYDNRNRLFLADLDTSKVQQHIPVDAEGNEITDFAAFGRGSRLGFNQMVHVLDKIREGRLVKLLPRLPIGMLLVGRLLDSFFHGHKSSSVRKASAARAQQRRGQIGPTKEGYTRMRRSDDGTVWMRKIELAMPEESQRNADAEGAEKKDSPMRYSSDQSQIMPSPVPSARNSMMPGLI